MNKQYVTLQVKALDDGSEHGSFEAVLSMPKIDRDNEVIDAYAFRPLPKSIPIFGDHVATIATTVGRGVPKYTPDGVLTVKGVFDGDDYSQLVRSKLRSQSVQNMSVGFMPRGSKSAGVKGKDGATHYPAGSLELLESSFVPIPSLREATVTMAKGLTTDLAEAGKLEQVDFPDADDDLGADEPDQRKALTADLTDAALTALDDGDEDSVDLTLDALVAALPTEG